MKKISLATTLIMGLSLGSCITQENKMNVTLEWKSLPDLPAASPQYEQCGLAGPLAGVASEHLIVAGGSNFPGGLPWQGGMKTYYEDIYWLDLSDGHKGWKLSETKLPEPMAYAASVSVNDEIYCIGGETSNGLLPLVLKMEKRNTDIQVESLTDYPVPVSNCSAASIGRMIYVAGGIGSKGAHSLFYRADISQQILSWEKLPDLPVAVSHAVVAAQSDGKEECIYVLGGRNETWEPTRFFSEVWKYSPIQNAWQKAGEISSGNHLPQKLAAGSGIAMGRNHIYLFGGDSGELFNRTETMIHEISEASDSSMKQDLVVRKNNHLSSHPGFVRDIFVFNTFSNRCSVVGAIPGQAQVTTTAVRVGQSVIIPNGEIRPGVRTPTVNLVRVQLN